MQHGARSARRGPVGALIALALVLALTALVILGVTLRGLPFLTLALATAALGLGALAARGAPTARHARAAGVGMALASVAIVLSLLGLLANLLISRDYDVYERRAATGAHSPFRNSSSASRSPAGNRAPYMCPPLPFPRTRVS